MNRWPLDCMHDIWVNVYILLQVAHITCTQSINSSKQGVKKIQFSTWWSIPCRIVLYLKKQKMGYLMCVYMNIAWYQQTRFEGFGFFFCLFVCFFFQYSEQIQGKWPHAKQSHKQFITTPIIINWMRKIVEQYIPLYWKLRGLYCKLRTEFFPLAQAMNRGGKTRIPKL